MIALAPVPTALLTAAATVAVVMVATWLVSLPLRNASIVDIVWGAGFVAVAWTVRFAVGGGGGRGNDGAGGYSWRWRRSGGCG